MDFNQSERSIMGEWNKKVEKVSDETNGVLSFHIPEGITVLAPQREDQEDIILPLSDFYFKVKKHEDLHKLGQSYGVDFSNNEKSFSFYSLDPKRNCSETMVALASYFSYQNRITPLVVTCKNNLSEYASLLGGFETQKCTLRKSGLIVEIINFSGLNVIEIDSLKEQMGELEPRVVVNDLLTAFGAIFWELPEISDFSERPERFFLAFQYSGNVSLQLNFKSSNVHKTRETIQFFRKYSIPIKGFVLDGQSVMRE